MVYSYYSQMVIGPAGSGKSTYCGTMKSMAETIKRNIIIINLDPASDYVPYKCDIDIRDLITLEDVMEEMKFGPNGGLIYCMEFLIENFDWFENELDEKILPDDYIIFDCPGQIELYTHLQIFKNLIKNLKNKDFGICSVCLLDSTFINSEEKFFSGALMALSTMISLELPHITVLTKCDLVEDKNLLDYFLNYEESFSYIKETNTLDCKIKQLLFDYNLVNFYPLEIQKEETILDILSHCDNSIQYGENLEPNDNDYVQAEERMMGN